MWVDRLQASLAANAPRNFGGSKAYTHTCNSGRDERPGKSDRFVLGESGSPILTPHAHRMCHPVNRQERKTQIRSLVGVTGF
jgi:hypothetical protein